MLLNFTFSTLIARISINKNQFTFLQMTSLVVRFNVFAMNLYVPSKRFPIDRPMSVLLASHEPQWDGPRRLGRRGDGTDFFPKPLTYAFTLGDLWALNSGEITYNLFGRRHPLYHENCNFQLKKAT
jgi:hypothetical protein